MQQPGPKPRTRLLLVTLTSLLACSSAATSSTDAGDAAKTGTDGGPADATRADARRSEASVKDGGASHHDGEASSDASQDSALACTPTTPPSGSPVIFAAPSPVAPGQVALLFGGSVGPGAQVVGLRLDDTPPGAPPRPADCVPPAATSLTVLQADELAAKAVIPSQWAPGLYALTVRNASGPSAPVVLNRPRIDWVRGGPGGAIVAGSSFAVYGRSFGAQPLAWLVDAGGTATPLTRAVGTTSDGYAATFVAPMLAPGAYDLYVHSGQGGPSGFSDALAVAVAPPSPWPTTVYPVAAGTGNDDQALAAAVTLAKNNGGGIVALAAGSYTLTQPVLVAPRTVLRSATSNRADVAITFNQAAIPFPYGFAGDHDFSVESITVTSSTSARLFQCPTGADFFRDPASGGPQYQPDPPCENARLHDVSFTLTTQRDRVINNVQTATPTDTIMVVTNGDDVEISDSSLTNTGGGVLSIAKANRLSLQRNTIRSGSSVVPASQPLPLSNTTGATGGGAGLYAVRESAIVGNTILPPAGDGASATLFIEYVAHDLYIADNTIGPNLSNYGEGFSFDAPYYPAFIGLPTVLAGRTLTIPQVRNAAGNSVFEEPSSGAWAANSGTVSTMAGSPSLVGDGVVVVNGTGLGQYAEVSSNAATAADGSTQLTVDRDWRIPLDATSVIAVTTLKSKVVFARNTFHDVAVGAQLYSGGYDFIIDGTAGEAMEGTYCIGNDFMSARASATDLQRRFSACYFDQWLNTTLTNHVDATYPWVRDAGPGVYTPYKNGLVGVQLGEGKDPLIPAARGIGAVGNIIRANQVADFTLGFYYAGSNGPLPSPMPTVGRDNVIEQNQTGSVPVGFLVLPEFQGTLVRGNTCTGDCETGVLDLTDGG